MDSYAIISLAMLVTSLVLAMAMTIAWASFGRPLHALSWAIAYFLYSGEIMISVLAATEPGIRKPADPMQFALVLAAASLVAVGARQRARLPSNAKAFAIAVAGTFVTVEIIRLLPIRADWVSTADGLFTGVMLILAISAISPRTRNPRPAERVVLGTLAVFALFELTLVVTDLAQEAAPRDQFRHMVHTTIYLCGLTPIFVANGIAAILLIASDLAGRLRVLASDDPLTGVLNRRGFQEAAALAVAIGRRRRQTIAVALADIDHFKSINDRFGHTAGDRTLHFICRQLVLGLRQGDLIGRIGGEEFALLLPNSTAEQAAEALDRIRQQIAEGFSADGAPVPVTTSFGVSVIIPGGSNETMLTGAMDRADRALYRSKVEGRNRVTIADAID